MTVASTLASEACTLGQFHRVRERMPLAAPAQRGSVSGSACRYRRAPPPEYGVGNCVEENIGVGVTFQPELRYDGDPPSTKVPGGPIRCISQPMPVRYSATQEAFRAASVAPG
jgi:hypothetical protein